MGLFDAIKGQRGYIEYVDVCASGSEVDEGLW